MPATESPIREWLQSIGTLAGVPITIDSSGAADIELSSGAQVAVEINAESELMLLSADLFAPKASETATVLERAMQLNHLGQGTGGATLGWDANRAMLVLSAVTPTQLLDEALFLELLSGFIELAEAFRNGLPQNNEATRSADTAGVSPTMVRG